MSDENLGVQLHVLFGHASAGPGTLHAYGLSPEGRESFVQMAATWNSLKRETRISIHDGPVDGSIEARVTDPDSYIPGDEA